jgi:N utilization substance protein A
MTDIIRKLDVNAIKYMNFFKTVTRVDAKDCMIFENEIFFITEKGSAGKAVGKGGDNIKTLRNSLKKQIKIFERGDSPEDLIKNFVFPLKIQNCALEDSKLEIKFIKSSDRRYLLGNQQEKLKQLKTVMKRFYPDIGEILILQ